MALDDDKLAAPFVNDPSSANGSAFQEFKAVCLNFLIFDKIFTLRHYRFQRLEAFKKFCSLQGFGGPDSGSSD